MGAPDGESRSPQEWLAAVRGEERRGELLAAFDAADRGLAEHPEDLALKHRAVLALARAGATEEAARRFAEYGLSEVHYEDVAALRARIAKDVALAENVPDTRRRRAERAAELYAEVFERTGGYYPAINAATLWLVAGRVARSRQLAETVMRLVATSGEDSYYAAATAAEAHLLCGDEAAAAQAIAIAATRHGEDYTALATTRRQLRMICEVLAIDPTLLSALAGPGVVHFCGHRIATGDRGGFQLEGDAGAAARIAEAVARRPAGYAYGALAGGGDILWAEALLARGSELHVVLPFSLPGFIELSVASCGPGWTDRFHRCLAMATEVRYATDDAFRGDDVVLRYGSELAMGLALLRARYLDADAWQLALWDGEPPRGQAGTAIDVATWRRTGRPVTVVSPRGEVSTGEARPANRGSGGVAPCSAPEPADRAVRAMLFGDLKGFSKLSDEQTPIFTVRVLGALASAVARYEPDILYRNTWGDAIFVVLTDAAVAAACALDLQDAMAAIDLESAGLPAHLALRLGGHVGPVFPIYDPVRGSQGFVGSHVSRTARIEPVTPPGTVYVTEAFAAALVLSGHRELACDYVGHMPAAKDYGQLRMYRLRRSGGSTEAP